MRLFCRIIAVVVVAGLATSARAVIVATSTDSTYTSGSGVPYFSNVLKRGSMSSVYLGNNWVLTAAHVGAGDVMLDDGTVVGYNTSSVHRLAAVGASGDTDIVLFQLNPTTSAQIAGVAALPMVDLARNTPAVGTDVTMIGFGIEKSVSRVYYNVTATPGDPAHPTWTPTTSSGPWNASGYSTTSNTAKHYGYNTTVAADGDSTPEVTDFNIGYGLVRGFVVEFTDVEGSAQGIYYDSGGGVFDSEGRLVGMIDAIGLYNNQPAFTAIFGDITASANLATYYDQIFAITGVPEPTSATLLLLPAGAAALRRRRRNR